MENCMIKIGNKAPKFKLNSSDGKMFSSEEDLKGNFAVIVFYPKNNTPG